MNTPRDWYGNGNAPYLRSNGHNAHFIDPDYMANEHDDQLPVISSVGRGPRGVGVFVEENSAGNGFHLINDVTGESEYSSGNLKGVGVSRIEIIDDGSTAGVPGRFKIVLTDGKSYEMNVPCGTDGYRVYTASSVDYVEGQDTYSFTLDDLKYMGSASWTDMPVPRIGDFLFFSTKFVQGTPMFIMGGNIVAFDDSEPTREYVVVPKIIVNSDALSGLADLAELLNDHVADTDIHVTAAKKAAWDAQASYSNLSNKPKINDTELSGNKSASDLGLADPASVTTAMNSAVSAAKSYTDSELSALSFGTFRGRYSSKAQGEAAATDPVDNDYFYVESGGNVSRYGYHSNAWVLEFEISATDTSEFVRGNQTLGQTVRFDKSGAWEGVMGQTFFSTRSNASNDAPILRWRENESFSDWRSVATALKPSGSTYQNTLLLGAGWSTNSPTPAAQQAAQDRVILAGTNLDLNWSNGYLGGMVNKELFAASSGQEPKEGDMFPVEFWENYRVFVIAVNALGGDSEATRIIAVRAGDYIRGIGGFGYDSGNLVTPYITLQRASSTGHTGFFEVKKLRSITHVSGGGHSETSYKSINHIYGII